MLALVTRDTNFYKVFNRLVIVTNIEKHQNGIIFHLLILMSNKFYLKMVLFCLMVKVLSFITMTTTS